MKLQITVVFLFVSLVAASLFGVGLYLEHVVDVINQEEGVK